MEATVLCFNCFTHEERAPSAHYTLILFCGMFACLHVWVHTCARTHTHTHTHKYAAKTEIVHSLFRAYSVRINEHQIIHSSETHWWNNQNMP